LRRRGDYGMGGLSGGADGRVLSQKPRKQMFDSAQYEFSRNLT
jgi:hypothetical protein